MVARVSTTRVYKHVFFRRRTQLWEAKPPNRYLGSCARQVDAARLVSRFLKVDLATLKVKGREKATSGRGRLYRHVSFHKGRAVWFAQLKGQPSPGSSISQHAAAALAAKALKVSVKSLLLPRCTPPAIKRNTQRDHFRGLWQVYRDKGAGFLPADLEFLERIQDKSCLSSPGLIVPFLLAKYPQHREALQKSFRKKRCAQVDDWEASVVVDALRLLHKKVLPPASSGNVGRNVAHHSGLITLANSSLRIITVATKGASGGDVLELGSGKKRFKVLKATKQTETKIKSWRRFGTSLLKIRPPRTLGEWRDTCKLLLKESAGVCGLARKGYRALWVCRSWLFYRMRSAGIMRLKVPKPCPISFLTDVFPDQKRALLSLATNLIDQTKPADVELHQLLQQLKLNTQRRNSTSNAINHNEECCADLSGTS
jgi:hypothetical protein